MCRTATYVSAALLLSCLVKLSVADEVPIKIESIRCQKTETVFGPDKVYYTVTPGGKGVTSDIHKLNDNESWQVNREAFKVERGKPVAVTVWDADEFFEENKEQIGELVGGAVGSAVSGLTGGTDSGSAVAAGKELGKRLFKKLKDADDLVLSAVIDTKKDGLFVLHQRRGSKKDASESYYIVTIKVGNPSIKTYELILKSIKCIEQEDWTGDDDPYIKVGFKRVWKGEMDDGDNRDLKNLTVRFTDGAIIELWEDDNDGDDHLGTNILSGSLAGKGDVRTTVRLTGCCGGSRSDCRGADPFRRIA